LEDAMTDQPDTASGMDSAEAARVLGVEPGEFDAMVEEELLSPLPGTGERRFDPDEVRALRGQGG
jgi:hypothetical protein